MVKRLSMKEISSSLIANIMFCCSFYTDYTSGFGGKFGVQNDRQDKSAVGWEHIEKVEKHESQKGINRAESN